MPINKFCLFKNSFLISWFREMSTQTTNTFESSIEILKDAIRNAASTSNSKNELNTNERTFSDLCNASDQCHAVFEPYYNHHYPDQPTSSISRTSNIRSNYFTSAVNMNYHTIDMPKTFYNMIPITLPAPLITRGVNVIPINGTRFYRHAGKLNHVFPQNDEINNHNLFTSCIIEKVLDYNPRHRHCVLKSCQVSLKGFDGKTRSSKIDFCRDGNDDT